MESNSDIFVLSDLTGRKVKAEARAFKSTYSAVSIYNAVINQHVLHIAYPSAGGFCFKRSLETNGGSCRLEF